MFTKNLVFDNMHVGLCNKTGSSATSPDKSANQSAAGEATDVTLYPPDVCVVRRKTGAQLKRNDK